ncbi:hypothetical protein N665_0233s0019 [Sinapis alba]|nr:hypothetical protein N665_0233s0019 [Sinapis alba]
MEVGGLDDYEITKSSTRIRVTVDGLKPLIKEYVLEFDSGEESIISLEYEKLRNHFPFCHRLLHLISHYPEKPPEAPHLGSAYQSSGTNVSQLLVYKRSSERPFVHQSELPPKDFNQRLDRHGRPFGERVFINALKVQGPTNKITPAVEGTHIRAGEASRYGSSSAYSHRNHQHSNFPPSHRNVSTQRGLVCRIKIPVMEDHNRTQSVVNTCQCNPLERSLAEHEFFPHPLLPSTGEFMEELREVTIQFMNFVDPTESVSRK